MGFPPPDILLLPPPLAHTLVTGVLSGGMCKLKVSTYVSAQSPTLYLASYTTALNSTAPSPIDPVLTVQPDHCYIFFSLKSTFKNYFINYHNLIHLPLVRRIRQTLKTKPLIMLLYNYNLLIQRIPIQQP